MCVCLHCPVVNIPMESRLRCLLSSGPTKILDARIALIRRVRNSLVGPPVSTEPSLDPSSVSMNTTSILNVGLNALLCTVLIALCKMSDLTMLKQFTVGVSSSKATFARSACKIFLMPCREADLGCGEEPGGEGI